MSLRGACLGILLAAAPLAQAADDLLYEVGVDGNIVFTNTPSRDTRPVPGFKTERRSTGAALPVTAFDPFIDQVASEFQLEPALIKAVALVESGFNPGATSPKGAKGLMQLMPATARSYGVRDIHDPYENLRAGANHLRTLLDEFDGDLTLALAAYNAGSGAVRKHGGVPRYRETQDYVRKVEGHLGKQTRRARAAPAPTRVSLRLNADGSVSLAN
ncbi:MAG TPA: lytic transglycosylase domain-containing protein [Candidatus Polarisedimenticolaceae bacterium]|nr:lytic transglycosylase domain-containing protein [Candidatus Polarisedimenticolaceae bacterium]